LLNSLHDKDILPLIIGGTHDFDVAQYQSYEMSEKLVSILNVDALVDMSDTDINAPETNHIHDILLHEPNFLFDYIHLGYQSYLVPVNSLEVLEKLNFNLIRLGKMRDKPKEVEPAIREADMMSFDLSAIQSSAMKATHNPMSFGLTGEEASQIAWYAGSSDKLSSAGFYGYDPLLDDERKSSAFVVGVMVWYFIEGYYNRKDRHDFSTKHYIKYIVSIADQDPGQIIFYKSSKSDKWWMELPFQSSKSLYSRNYVVPCSYEDYTAAGKGDVPDRWVSAYAKLSLLDPRRHYEPKYDVYQHTWKSCT
jgi:formiminoglutamase